MSSTKPEFQMVPVRSSNIADLGYDPATRELRVRFAKGGLFSYADVPQTEYDALRQASSIGAHFSSKIRNKFKATDLRAMSADSAREFLNRSNKA